MEYETAEERQEQIITTDYLTKIEVALNIPAGHTEVSPKIRLEGILQSIQTLSHRAGYVNVEYAGILNGLVDYLDAIHIDFQKDFDCPEEYEQEWNKWKERFYRRPGRYSTPPALPSQDKK